MNIDAYNKFFEDAIEEINEMKSQLSLVQRGIRFTKCAPFRINPSPGPVKTGQYQHRPVPSSPDGQGSHQGSLHRPYGGT